ncbi:MAG: hypothetical protein MI806_30855 [Minwuiales bacterium]|nr:hypothetical protein [Minwuiales bacterium]
MSIRPGVLMIVAAAFMMAAPFPLSSAKAGVIFQSAELIAVGNTGGVGAGRPFAITGTRFSITETVQVDMIGGHFSQSFSGSIFGAIVPLSRPNSNPIGSLPDIALASTTFTVPFPGGGISVDFLTPLSVVLSPGSYGVLFGTGLFGATSTSGPAFADNNTNPSAPTYFLSSDNSTWFSVAPSSNEPDSFPRMVVTGTVLDGAAVPGPGMLALFAAGLASLGLARRKRAI